MKLVVNIQLQPLDLQADALLDTIRRSNQVCNFISQQAVYHQVFHRFKLHSLVYYEVRKRFNFGSVMTCQCIAKVADAYQLSTFPVRKFRPLGAINYHAKEVTLLKGDKVSIWTTQGRLKIPYICGDRQRDLLQYRKGEMDLIYRKGKFYLNAVCDVPEEPPYYGEDVLGVDLGIVNIASDSDGEQFSGAQVEHIRQTFLHRRRNLQRKGTKAAKRKLKQLSGKQSRFQKDVNHCISKRLVVKAKGTMRSIAVEDLTGIRERVTVRKRQRHRLNNWSFFDLRKKIEYKAKLYGVPVVAVDPRNTSRQCSVCSHISKSNRKTQSAFVCVNCGFSDNADLNASRNIRDRGDAKRPNAAYAVR